MAVNPEKIEDGKARPLAFGSYKSPIGPIRVAASAKGVALVAIALDERDFYRELKARLGVDAGVGEEPGGPSAKAAEGRLENFIAELGRYFTGKLKIFSTPVDLAGRGFDMRVWRAIASIPYGKTTSYSSIASTIGDPRAARAVGNACGRNPVPIIVPCHRVLKADGGLGGYTGGLWIKEALLKVEGAIH